jgi:hypothetical protein
MKMTKLSLVAALAVSAAFAGGDIAPVEPAVEAPVAVVVPCGAKPGTTIAGKLTGYYITDDSTDDMFGDQQQLAFGATLDVSHAFTDWLTANFSAVGYLNALKNSDSTWGYFEGAKKGAFFNVANLTATYADTTLIAGRQLLGTPMLQGYDWLLAPGSFEAYTVANSSIDNLTLVGSYVTKHRGNNSGEFGNDLPGDNYAFGAAYDDKTINGSVWYYNVDAGNYTQVYADLGYDFGSFKVAGQYVTTDAATDTSAFGLMASTSISGFDLSAAYNRLIDGKTAYVGWNGLYTNQWNLTVADQYNGQDLDAFKVAAATTVMGVSAELSYADYDGGNETDLILGYDFSDAIDAGVVYTNTKANQTGASAVNQLEVYANYKF